MTQTATQPCCQTRYFGQVQYEEESVLVFPDGIPAFEHEKRFLLLRQPMSEPLVFLQSEATPSLCFAALPVRSACPGYRLQMTVEDLEDLGLETGHQPVIGEDVLCLAILSLEENRPPTVNLLAPVVVNLRTLRGLQAIQMDSVYSHRAELPLREAVCW